MTAHSPPVTLAVVTRDRAHLLERHLLAGLRDIAAGGTPVVVVDQSVDGRTERLVAELPNVSYLRSGPGLSVGRNVALGAVRSEIVVFTDDDVRVEPPWIDAVIQAFESAPRAGAVCGRARDSAGALLPGGRHGEHTDPAEVFSLGSGFNLSLRMAAVVDVGGFDEDLGAGGRYPAAEDTDMLYRLLRSGWTVSCRDDVTVVHEDWRTKRQQLRLHYRYGVGSGAQTAKHLHAGDRAALLIGVRRAGQQCGRMLRSVGRGHLRTAVIEIGFVAGMITGFAKRFLDHRPARHPIGSRR